MNTPKTDENPNPPLADTPGSAGCIHYVDKLPYRAWHEDAEKRYKAKERQRRCPVCLKWIWESYWPKQSDCDKVISVKTKSETDLGPSESETYAWSVAHANTKSYKRRPPPGSPMLPDHRRRSRVHVPDR